MTTAPTLEEQFNDLLAEFQIAQNASILNLNTVLQTTDFTNLLAAFESASSPSNSIPNGNFRKIIGDFASNLASIKTYVQSLADPLLAQMEENSNT